MPCRLIFFQTKRTSPFLFPTWFTRCRVELACSRSHYCRCCCSFELHVSFWLTNYYFICCNIFRTLISLLVKLAAYAILYLFSYHVSPFVLRHFFAFVKSMYFSTSNQKSRMTSNTSHAVYWKSLWEKFAVHLKVWNFSCQNLSCAHKMTICQRIFFVVNCCCLEGMV